MKIIELLEASMELSKIKKLALERYPYVKPEEAVLHYIARQLKHNNEDDQHQNIEIQKIEDKLKELENKLSGMKNA